MKMRVTDSRSQRGEDRQAWKFVHGLMMQTLFCQWIGLGLVGIVFCGCSEKVETMEKQKKVEEEVVELKTVDPVEEVIANRMRSIVIPRIDFEDRTVEEAIDYLRLRAAELEVKEPEPTKRGVSLVIRRPKGEFDTKPIDENSDDLLGGGLDPGSKRIPELRLRNIPLSVALRYICIMTNLRCEVDESRLTISPKAPNTAWDDVGSLLEEKGDTSVISTKLGQIRIPRIDFENTSIHEAMDFLRFKSAEMNSTEVDPSKKGINYVVHMPSGMTIPSIDKLEMDDVPVEEVLKQISIKTGMRYKVEPYSVILVPKDLK